MNVISYNSAPKLLIVIICHFGYCTMIGVNDDSH